MVRGRSRRLGRPPAVDGDETRQRILCVAQRCFADRGFEGATNGEIAEMAELTSGSIYHHFGSKLELYAAVCDDARFVLRERLETAVAVRKAFSDKITALLDVAIQMDEEQPLLAKFFISAVTDAGRHAPVAEAVDRWLADIGEFLSELVHDGVTSGEVDAEHAESLVELIEALILGLSHYAALVPAERHATVLKNCQRLILKGNFWAPKRDRYGEVVAVRVK